MKRPSPPGATLTQMVDADAEGSGNLINKICAKAAGFWRPTVGALKKKHCFFWLFFFSTEKVITRVPDISMLRDVGGNFFCFWMVCQEICVPPICPKW